MSEELSKRIKMFDALVPKCAEQHTLSFCFKEHRPRPTIELKGEECLRCRGFIANGGVCDPL